jgi:hypothetical protein
MTRMILIAAGLAIVLTAPRIASAQAYRGSSTDNPNGSTVSPYLNLLNNNNIGLPAYQTQVKPILDSQNAIQRQGNSIQRLQQQVNSGTTRGGTGTGQTTFFMNYSHYYTRSSRGR